MLKEPSKQDLETLRTRMLALEKLPSIRKGMESLGMRSLFDWFEPAEQERIANLDSPYCHPLQRPYFFFPGLRAKMFVDPKEFSWASRVEAATPAILEELQSVLEQQKGFQPYRTIEDSTFLMANNRRGADATDRPDWNMFYFYFLGKPVAANCALCPKTAALLRSVPRFTPSSISCFSALNPNTHIAPHFGPNNTVLRVHLGLKMSEGCRLRVGTETRTWEQGKLLVFSDAFDHQVWHEGDETRIVLFFDILHPDWEDEELGTVEALTRDFAGMEEYTASLHEMRAQDANFHGGARWWV